MRTKKKWLFAAYMVLYMYILYVFCMPWYCSVEARYARDNLAYLSGRLSDIGVMNGKINTNGDDYFHWPYDKSLKKIYELSTEWGDAFIGHVALKGGTDREDLNPYDTLSRLKYDSAIPEVQSVYKAVMMRAAITNPEKDYSQSLVASWLHERKEFDNEAEDSFHTMEKQKLMCSVILLLASLPFMIYMLILLDADFISILKKHNNSMKKLDGTKKEIINEENDRDNY